MRVVAPVAGEILDIANVPDEVFSSQMLGGGLAVVVTENHVSILSPMEGEILKAMPHAVVVRAEQYAVLIHVGVDTVSNQEYFECLVEKGDQVYEGQTLIHCSLTHIIAADTRCPVIMTVLDIPAERMVFAVSPGQQVKAGEHLLSITEN